MQRPGKADDVLAVARFMDRLAGGIHARAAEEAPVREIEALWPRIGDGLRETMAFHMRAAEWSVREGARSVIFCISGYPPSWEGARLPHLDAAAADPGARYAYCSAAWTMALLWEEALGGDPRCVALEASAASPSRVLRMATAAGMEPPFSVHLPLALHWWGREDGAAILAGYAACLRELGPGSNVVLSAAVPGGRPAGGKVQALTGLATGTLPHAWTPGGIESAIAAGGLKLHPCGIRDVRDHDGNGWAAGELASHDPGWFAGAVALA
jgi:hypothetical protein